MTSTLRQFLPESIISLAESCPAPLYAVGGVTRDFLAGYSIANGADIDVCAPIKSEDFISIAQSKLFTVTAVYKATGTVKLKDSYGNAFEFSPFRTDKYVRGVHTPTETFFTDDIVLDAKRRDFTCNAIYYNIAEDAYLDPMGGIGAVKEKRLTTVAPSEKVFGEDGLRLMRLARFASQLGFTPDGECIEGAKQNADMLCDIKPERIWAELSAILLADKRHDIPYAHYAGLKVLDETRVLDKILPELTAGRGLTQRSDFHSYDVLEHSLRCAKYAPPYLTARYTALLHDVGKPVCYIKNGNFHEHDAIGAALSEKISARLKVPRDISKRVSRIIALHMYDLAMNVNEGKLKRFFVENYPVLSDLMEIKQADFSACKDDLSPCPTNARWKKILGAMKTDNAPLTLSALKIKGDEVRQLGFEKNYTAKILHSLLLRCAVDPSLNKKETLLRLASGAYREIKNNEAAAKNRRQNGEQPICKNI